MSDKLSNIQVMIMCKAPVEGKVKTRLMQRYSAKEATELHAAMATTVIERAKRLFKYVSLAVDDVSHPFFKAFSLPVLAQGEGDLGMRMQYAMRQTTHHHPILFLGTDSPHMKDARLIQAVTRLQQGCDVVLGAVEDGGYDLIAMKHHNAALFDDISWSSEYVLTQTESIAKARGLICDVLDISFDVDTADMLQRAILEGWDVHYPYLEGKA